jgi:sulfur-oxidizing protein SoxA
VKGRVRAWLALLAILLPVASAGEIRPEERRSDTAAMSPETRAMQADDTANPGMFAVLEGEEIWRAKAGSGVRSCADCHGEPSGMRGVAARYPAWSPERGAPIDLAGQVNLCRTSRQGAAPFEPESAPLLAVTALLGHASRGEPIAPPQDAGMRSARERGRELFTRRIGQLNLSCAACHDDHWSKRLAGTSIPQAHPVGYPIYRLEWQGVGSLHRRFRNCMSGVRASPTRSLRRSSSILKPT